MFSARGLGVARVSYEDRKLGTVQKLMSEGGSDGVLLAEHLGLSFDFIAVASPINQLIWQSRKEPAMAGQLGEWGDHEHAPISFFEDIDLRGDRLAILGLMRAAHGMSPDGAIAWIGRLGSRAVPLRPIAFSAAGKGAAPVNSCAATSVGKIRFLSDGRLLVLPGAEPGIFVYSLEGKLLQTFDTAALGLDLHCDFDEATRMRFGSDVRARLDYLNRFTTVEEVLPLDRGPALILRSAGSWGTRWRVVLLGEGGANHEIPLPITSSSPNSHLRGDVLGSRIVLLQSEWASESAPKAEVLEFGLEAEAPPPKARHR
ncbi:MAG: hypothetical protein ABI609_11810 [Acidobacteriota bacterium]